MNLLKEVLADIRPDREEQKEVEEKIKDFISKLNKNLKDGKAVLGGSGAKGTWLSHAHDADIFVQFNYNKYKNKSDKLSDILEKVLKKAFGKIKRLHGSRDYFQIKQKNFTFEIVPILKITKAKDALNITDVSPLHAAWVNQAKPLADEIRLTKQFMKAIEVYGAESYIKGFSGYMAEALTIQYGGFLKLVKAAAKWDEKTIIDPKKYYRNKNDVLMSINKSKQQGPMILVDPVQKDRNVAAALNEEKYLQFVNACKDFLKKQNKSFFEIDEITIDDLKKKAKKNKLVLVKIGAKSGKGDVVGSKLLKAFEFIKKEIEKNDFKLYESGWKWDKGKNALFWFVADKKILAETVEIKGPPLKYDKGVKDFKKKHKKTFVKNKVLWAKDKRKFRDVSKLIKKAAKNEYVREKVKSISFS